MPNVTEINEKTNSTPGKPLLPDAEGFFDLHCSNCEESIRFRTAETALLQGVSEYQLSYLRTLKLILDRDREASTPAERFVSNILLCYAYAEENGRGLTVEDVEPLLDEFRKDIPDAIEFAHFMSRRYPVAQVPEASNAK